MHYTLANQVLRASVLLTDLDLRNPYSLVMALLQDFRDPAWIPAPKRQDREALFGLEASYH